MPQLRGRSAKYRSLKVPPRPAAPTTSKEAAAAAAAAVLATIDAKTADEMKGASRPTSRRFPVAQRNRMASSSARPSPQRSWRRGRTTAPMRPMTTGRGGLCAHGDHGGLDVAEPEAVRHRQGVPISARPADFAGKQGVGDGLQRAQRLWRTEQCEANGPADRDRPVLARQFTTLAAKQMSVVDSARFMALVTIGHPRRHGYGPSDR